jgi:hypothetical protein
MSRRPGTCECASAICSNHSNRYSSKWNGTPNSLTPDRVCERLAGNCQRTKHLRWELTDQRAERIGPTVRLEYHFAGLRHREIHLARSRTNSTFFYSGSLNGKKETFITPGIIVGYFQIAERLHLGIGGGIQIAATHFHTYNHRWIWSVRLPF